MAWKVFLSCYRIPIWMLINSSAVSFLMTINSSVNFIIYSVTSKDFRNEFRAGTKELKQVIRSASTSMRENLSQLWQTCVGSCHVVRPKPDDGVSPRSIEGNTTGLEMTNMKTKSPIVEVWVTLYSKVDDRTQWCFHSGGMNVIL